MSLGKYLRFLALYVVASQSILPPSGDGKYSIATAHIALTDPNRRDPFAPDGRNRRLVISMFYPINRDACNRSCIITFPNTVAQRISTQYLGDECMAPALAQARIDVCCEYNEVTDPKRYPLVIFQPAVDTTRLLYSGLAAAIAGQGYTVITTDHPYDAAMLQYPWEESIGGFPKVLNNISLSPLEVVREINQTYLDALSARIDDHDFVIRSLTNATIAKLLLPNSPEGSAFDVKRYAVMGHGLGGGAATDIGTRNMERSEVAMVINLDGTGSPSTQTMSTPFVFFGRYPEHTHKNDPGLRVTWPHILGDKHWEWDVRNAGALVFSDLAYVVPETARARVQGLGSGVNSTMVWLAVWAFSVAFLDECLKGRGFLGVREAMEMFKDVEMFPGFD